MRRAELSFIPSIKLVSLFSGFPINEAKWIVPCSDAWADCAHANDALHDAAHQAAKEISFEEVWVASPAVAVSKNSCGD